VKVSLKVHKVQSRESSNVFICHPQLDWGSSLNQRFWIPDQAGNDNTFVTL